MNQTSANSGENKGPGQTNCMFSDCQLLMCTFCYSINISLFIIYNKLCCIFLTAKIDVHIFQDISKIQMTKIKIICPAQVVQLVGPRSCARKGCGFDPQSGIYMRQLIDVSLPLSPFFSPFLSL